MSKTKVIVLVGSSEKSWEDAVRQVVRKASESVGEIVSVDVVHQSACANDGEITEFRATVHVSFEFDTESEMVA